MWTARGVIHEVRRNGGLDAIRLAGALCVVVAHAAYRSTEDFGHPLVPLGGVGVSMFFVLSGYLIPTVFAPGSAYWIRRAARVFPGYWFAVLGLGVMLAFVPAVADLTMTQRLESGSGVISPEVNVVAVVWTLRIELVFYALVPILVRLPTWGILLGGAVSLIASQGQSGEAALLFPFHLWRFVPGLLLARWSPSRPLPWVIAIVGVAALALAIVSPSGEVLAAAGSGLLVAVALSRPGRIPRWVAFGATISYGIFLWHQQLLYVLGVVPGLVATLAAASVSWFLIERPANRWAARTPSPSGSPRTSSPHLFRRHSPT